MKQDYVVRWSEMARFQLLDKAEYIRAQAKFPPSLIPHRSVHLDARKNHAWNVI